MAETSLVLTDRAISALPGADSGQYFARDQELPGFAVLVGKRKKTFVVQGDVRKDGRRQSVRIKIAEVGALTTREARAWSIGPPQSGFPANAKPRGPIVGQVPASKAAAPVPAFPREYNRAR
jgi:hypothetical protein